MTRTFPALLLATAATIAAVPNTFSSGKSVVAREVNDNFTYLDSIVGKKANQTSVDAVTAALATKADVSLKDSLKNRVDLPMFNALKAKQSADSGTLGNAIKSLPTTSSLTSLQDAMAAKKDSSWISKNVTATSIGAFPTTGGTISGPTIIRHNLDVAGGGVIHIQDAGGIYSSFAQIRDTVNVGNLKGNGTRIVVTN